MSFIEVCAGCGGLSAGLIEAGLKPLLLMDNDETCHQTLRMNHPDVNVQCLDIKSLDVSCYKDQVDLLAGGIPCQSFSQAGKRLGFSDDRGSLIFTFVKLLKQCHPKMFLIENVKGLVTHDHGATFEHIKQVLSMDGVYHVSAQVLNAVDYSVPQKRERVFIIGKRKDLFQDCEFQYPQVHPRRVVLRDVLLDCPACDECMLYSENKRRIMERIPPGGCWINLPEDLQKTYMGASYSSGGGKRGMARRMHLDEPCLTLTTSPSQKQTERCHPLEVRPFNVREYARIQTFPDTYMFSGSTGKKYKQIGNAVPVKLAKAVGLQIIAALQEVL